jgi:hypothetical protein
MLCIVDDNEHDPAERFESIPWSSLLPEENDRRTRWLGIGAAIALAVVAGLIAIRVSGSSPPGTVVALDPASTPQDPVVAAIVSTTAVPPDLPTDAGESVTLTPGRKSVPEALPYSEADLMAAAPDTQRRAAIMRAEWFVTDFFTVDEDASAEAVAAALVPLEGMVLPHESPVGVSYVEWARAYAVEPLPVSGYRVAVAFRTLSAPEGEEVIRRPVRAVQLDVAVEPDGATAVLDLPRPVSLPAPALSRPPAAAGSGIGSGTRAPAEFEAAAIESARTAGSGVSVLGAEPHDGGWRFVVAVVDESGMAFPLSVWLPAS